MKRRRAQVLHRTDPERLDMSPHIMPQLVDMVLGDWQSAPPDLEQVLTHLVECVYCQVTLGTLMSLELDSGISDESSEELRKLLTRLTRIIHETKAQGLLGMYIEVLESQGEGEANGKFPVLAEHLKRCEACQSTVEGTVALLRQAEQAGLIDPSAIHTKEQRGG